MKEGDKKEKTSVTQKLLNYAKKYYEKLKENEVKQLFKAKVMECFELGEVYKKYGNEQVYPQIVRIGLIENGIEAVLNLPRGLKPSELEEKSYVFEQEFGQNIELKKVSSKTFVLYVFVNNPLKETYPYDYSSISSKLERKNLPIYIGKDSRGKVIIYDMIDEPNLLVAGEPGSGKSVTLRSLITTLIFNKTPEELKLYLFDLKRSEFFIFERLPHVIENTHDQNKIKSCFTELVKELAKRGDLLANYRVPHIIKLPQEARPPFIIICIDEFSLIQDKSVIENIQHIAALGRALGVYIILSTQRPDKDTVNGRIKVLLTVRIGGRMQDVTNSKIIIDCGGCEKLTSKGHMKMKYTNGLIDVKTPLLDEGVAEKMLDPLRVEVTEEQLVEQKTPTKKKKVKKSKVIDWGVLK